MSEERIAAAAPHTAMAIDRETGRPAKRENVAFTKLWADQPKIWHSQ
jgi:hypothetical protein